MAEAADAEGGADPDGGLAGDKKDTPAAKKQVKNEHILIAVGLITLVVTVLYLRKSAANATSTNSATPTVNPATQYGGGGGGGSDNENSYMNNELATIAADMDSMNAEVTGLQGTVSGLSSNTGGGAAGSGTTTPVSPTTLPPVNAGAWQQLYEYGQYTSDEFTQIGSESAQGQYSGEQVSGGVPVFASNGFGGLQQGVNPFASGTKAGTTFYIPTEYTGYEHN
jgi:hypothetical protein